MKSARISLLCLVTILTTSCGSPDPKSKEGSSQSKGAAKKSSQKKGGKPAPDSETVKLSVATWEETLKLVKKNKGKVVVVDVWSTNCPPCMKEYPHLIELHHKHKEKVVCISVSLDNDGTYDKGAKDPELQTRVMGFLKQTKSVITNLVCEETDEQFYAKQKPPLLNIPAVYVYDKEGKLQERFDDSDQKRLGGPFTYPKHIFPMVEKLLK